MRTKLKLNPDELTVESFAPHPRWETARGTVRAREETEFLCSGHTCHVSCFWSEDYCHTQQCGTDFDTCMQFGSCCPARCNSGEPW